MSLVILGFSVFFLITDFFYSQVINTNYLYVYRKLDILLAFISLLAVLYYWVLKFKSALIIQAGNIFFIILILQWSAIVTGIEFKIYGLSTFIIVLLTCTFYLYFNIFYAIILFTGSCVTLLATIYFRGEYTSNFFSMFILLLPTSIFCIMINTRNYRNKIRDLLNQEKLWR
jgi:hypothetical protein